MAVESEKERLLKRLHEHDPIWHVQLTLLAVIFLQVSLPDRFSAGPRFGLPILEVLLLILLSATDRRNSLVRNVLSRINVVAVLVLLALGNMYGLQRLSHDLLVGGKISNGHELIRTSINIYLTNIIVFALIYWMMDGGGREKRGNDNLKNRDFLFTQMSAKEFAPPSWLPAFGDYLALSGTTALAFGPTDTLPTRRPVRRSVGSS